MFSLSKIHLFRDVFQKDNGYFGLGWFVYDLRIPALTRIYWTVLSQLIYHQDSYNKLIKQH